MNIFGLPITLEGKKTRRLVDKFFFFCLKKCQLMAFAYWSTRVIIFRWMGIKDTTVVLMHVTLKTGVTYEHFNLHVSSSPYGQFSLFDLVFLY